MSSEEKEPIKNIRGKFRFGSIPSLGLDLTPEELELELKKVDEDHDLED